MAYYRTLKKIVIPAGTEIFTAASKIKRFVPYGEALIGFGKNHCAFVAFDEDLMEAHPKVFIRDSD